MNSYCIVELSTFISHLFSLVVYVRLLLLVFNLLNTMQSVMQITLMLTVFELVIFIVGIGFIIGKYVIYI